MHMLEREEKGKEKKRKENWTPMSSEQQLKPSP